MKRSVLVSAVIGVLLVACGGGDGETDVRSDESKASLSIEEPSDGAEVAGPFTVNFSSNADLGSVESGASHVHLWIDGNEDDYEVIEGDSFEIKDLPPGEHTITVSLRKADHSAAGAQDEITVIVSDDGGAGEEGGEDEEGY